MYNDLHMKTVYLIRHAAYSNPQNILPGRLPLPLSEEGINKATQLAKFLAEKNVELIYSSQVLRAKQTSEIIQQNHPSKPEIQFDQRILETLTAYQGFWEANAFDGGMHYFAHRDELGGENLEDIQKRMVSFWNDKILPNAKSNIVVVTHDFCLLTLLKHLKNLPLPESNQYNEKDADYMLKASVCEVNLNENGVQFKDFISF
jgi:broad specificity phosphatase PhoE